VIYALATGGVLAALYAVVLRRRPVSDRRPPQPALRYLPMIVDFVTPLLLVPFFGLHSFVACGIGVVLALVCIFAMRSDLIVVGLVSAALGMLISLPCYWLIEWLLPGFIRAVWDLPRLSGILMAGIPIEDLAWYAYSAALFGTFYKFASGQSLMRR
jgi:hypothetical protein